MSRIGWIHNSLEDDYTSSSNSVMDLVHGYPLLKSFLAGALSGTCSTLLFQPLDLVKTRIQNASSRGSHKGMMSLMIQVAKDERLLGLWRGTVPSISRCIPGIGMYFCSLHWIQTSFNLGNPSPIEAVCCGVMARTLAGSTLLPFTVIKTRFESGVYRYGSLTEALKVIYRTEGTRGLFSGLIPTLFRDAPFSGIYLMFYTQTKTLIPKDWKEGSSKAPADFGCGLAAGLLASFVTQPPDVIKTQMQLYPKKFGRLKSAIIFIYQEYGLSGFFKGIVPRIVRRSLMSATAWTIYEQVTRNMGLK
ncbi:solute carrier family 25 member 38-A-like [Centruroides sculpturatus]|uniref:solute carrier family 25 member 38-A-like n=1 Tax=Centruroides sculpturatus TaxID=218467 RepID=UPI000C6E9290|nr:solute carrier family 25 member 38-A-like [Centruroides sculpturatus]XP_023240300.1 solute carrier family 25 member 38-A-like [Centruroides sculpturatus]XP_023240307.1 solute carrier family 25 member 38-A-like [Centruroides sculpturatus]